MTTQIKSVGIELECGVSDSGIENIEDWIEDEGDIDCLNIGSDASVYVDGYDHPSSEIKYYSHDIKHLFEFLDMSFGYIKQNNTCGNHIHVRFKKPQEAIALFGYREAFNYFKREYIKAFGESGKFHARLRNRYCNGNAYSEDLALSQLVSSGRCEARYRMINLNSHRIHGTIEFRILPYFMDGDEAKDSIKKLLSIIDRTYAHILNSKNCHCNEFKDIPYYKRQMDAYLDQIGNARTQVNVNMSEKLRESVKLEKHAIAPINITPTKAAKLEDIVVAFRYMNL